MLVFSLYSVKREKHACEINWITITGWGEGARTLCCTGGVCVPSAEGPDWKELQQKAQSCVAVAPHSPIHCASNASRMWLVPNIGEKWGERERERKKRTEIFAYLVVCFSRRLGYSNAQSSFLSSPGSLYKLVELLWSSTSDSLRRIKWSTMRA